MGLFGWNTAKAETQCRLCTARIKLQRNKRAMLVKNMRKEIAELLRSGKQEYARIRVEGVIRENLLQQAYEILELYLELVAVRSQLIAKTKEIPRDMVEAISSIIYAAQRVSDMPELNELRSLFASKYGKEYAAEASSDVTCSKWQVNANLIRCLLVEPPQPEEKLAMLSEIAQESGVEWDLDSAARSMLPGGAPRGGARTAPPILTPIQAEPMHAAPAAAPPGIPQGFTQMDPHQAAAAAAAAASHAKAMADYAAQLAGAAQAAPPQHAPPGDVSVMPPPAGWLLQSTPGTTGTGAASFASSASGAAGPSQPGGAFVNVVDHTYQQRTQEEIQRAYDAAVGPPAKGAKTQAPASAPPPPGLTSADSGTASLPSPPLDLPRPPMAMPRAPDGTIPGTVNLPHPPTAKVGEEPEDEVDELTRRLEALKRG